MLIHIFKDDILQIIARDFGPQPVRYCRLAGGSVRTRLDGWRRDHSPQDEGALGPTERAVAALGGAEFALAAFSDIVRWGPSVCRTRASRVIEEAFWTQCDGYLIGPTLLRLLAWAEDLGGVWVVEEAQSLQKQIFLPFSWGDVLRTHAEARLRWLTAGAEGVSDPTVGLLEFLADYFLLQRAVADDVRWASRYRSEEESTAVLLCRGWKAGRLRFTRTLSHLADAQEIERALRPEAWDPVREFARVRNRFPEGGILTLPDAPKLVHVNDPGNP